MTPGKTTALVLGFAGTFALGVWIGAANADRTPADTAALTTAATDTRPAPAAPRAATEPRGMARVDLPDIEPDNPDLQRQLKPVLNRGTKLDVAAEGFDDGEQFAAVAYAARNTSIPFLVLKHQVVDEGQTLQRAIATLKPDVNAAVEANRARAEAQAAVASIG